MPCSASDPRYPAVDPFDHVWALSRTSGKVLSRFGRSGRYAGQLHWIHNMAVASSRSPTDPPSPPGERVG